MLPGSMPTPPYSVGYGSLSPYSSSLPPHPFLYPPYDFLCYRSPHQSLPPLPSHGLPPLPPATMAKAKHASLPPLRSASTLPAAPRKTVGESSSSYKRKKPRAPDQEPAAALPRAARRRKPLQRAAPLPAAPAVVEALDDLEREVTRGFVEDLVHALAPPPSSLPLPTFSLVRAAAAAKAAPPSCAV